MEGFPIILHVEDESNDVALFELACERAKVSFRIRNAGDGEQAINWLSTVGDSLTTDTAPSLVLLDLKLPGKNGFEVLKWIRAQPRFEHLPIVVFTSSTVPADIALAYRNGATGYLVKPARFDQLLQVIQAIDSFWLRWNKTPEISIPFQIGKTADRLG